MLIRKEWEEFEKKFLAPYASKSCESKGRKFYEPEHLYRTCFQRDRDRIIHSAAFRRLEYKTQVFLIHEGDYFRTRLTHTIEVSQIAKTIAKVLRLNEDLTEAIALAHDLGHTPFGHAGEEILNELMKEEGGFNHNLQGLRVVEFLEERYPNFRGLNLTWEVREGIAKHSSNFKEFSDKIEEYEPQKNPSLEAQIVSLADEIAYDSHDLDDGLKNKMLEESSLKKLEIYKRTEKEIKSQYANLSKKLKIRLIIRRLIDWQVSDLIDTTRKRLKKFNIRNVEEVRNFGEFLVSFSKEMQDLRAPLREFLFFNLYKHQKVVRMACKAKRILKELFYAFEKNPEQLPPDFQNMIKRGTQLKRVVCDYIAGMTDRYAYQEYKNLFLP